jgi:hypothetical protein
MFQKFHSPNQLKYLTGDFSKVSAHPKQQLLLKMFFYKFKKWTELSCCIWLVFFLHFFNYLRFLGCFKSSPALTSVNISWATSVMLVHTVSNNFYFKCFSISSKTGPSFVVEMANFFLFNYVFQDVSNIPRP